MSQYSRILVCIDTTPGSTPVIARGRALAEVCGAQLTLLHVVEYQPPLELDYGMIGVPDWGLNEDELVRAAEERLAAIATESGAADALRLVRVGLAKHEIPQYAEETGTDLIVLGSHGRRGIGRLLGSTADSVLHHAPCDVLAVRIKNTD
ncbi:MAG: universal stress protein [Chromatiales bacterium]|jgi:universal stress protein A|nr:universal stress protein [Chromatiales bacterium]MDX9766003.1 universal stress protein [Ectothiorhodospiraceae bacterium]